MMMFALGLGTGIALMMAMVYSPLHRTKNLQQVEIVMLHMLLRQVHQQITELAGTVYLDDDRRQELDYLCHHIEEIVDDKGYTKTMQDLWDEDSI